MGSVGPQGIKGDTGAKEAKALLAPKDLQGHCEVTGISVCLKIYTRERTLD